MRKSPFSTPRGGNSGKRGLWNSGGSSGSRGYAHQPKSFEFNPNQSSSSQKQSGSDDFIPFDNTPPPVEKKFNHQWKSPSGNWQGSRGGRANRRPNTHPGYARFIENRGRNNQQQQQRYGQSGWKNHQQLSASPASHFRGNRGNRFSTSPAPQFMGNRGNRFSASPASRFTENSGESDQQQPLFYEDSGSPFRGGRQNFKRGSVTRNPNSKVPISIYVNLQWFLEDPWAELENLLQTYTNSADEPVDESELLESSFESDEIDDDDAPMENDERPANMERDGEDNLSESSASVHETSQEFRDEDECIVSSTTETDPKAP